MPLQVMIAVFLALLTLGVKWQPGSGRQNEVVIVSGDHYAQAIKNDTSPIIVVTTVYPQNNKMLIIGQRREQPFKSIFTGHIIYRINHEANKNHKRNIQRAV
jgi:hypothetical protein